MIGWEGAIAGDRTLANSLDEVEKNLQKTQTNLTQEETDNMRSNLSIFKI